MEEANSMGNTSPFFPGSVIEGVTKATQEQKLLIVYIFGTEHVRFF
jgi:hypothetical protein